MTVPKPWLSESKTGTAQGVYKMKESNAPVSVGKSTKRFERMINKGVMPPGGRGRRRSSQSASEDDEENGDFEEEPQEENVGHDDCQEHMGAKNGARSSSDAQAEPVSVPGDLKGQNLAGKNEDDLQSLSLEESDSDSSDSQEESRAWKDNVSVESVMTDQNELSKIIETRNASEKEGKTGMSRDGSLQEQSKLLVAESGEGLQVNESAENPHASKSDEKPHTTESDKEVQAAKSSMKAQKEESDKKLEASKSTETHHSADSDGSAGCLSASRRKELADAISKSLSPLKKGSEQSSDKEDGATLEQEENSSENDTEQETMGSEFMPKVSVSTSFDDAPKNKTPSIKDSKTLQPELEAQPSRAASAASQRPKPPNDVEKNQLLAAKTKKKCCGLC